MEIIKLEPILDLLKSQSREDFELGVNILEAKRITLNGLNFNSSGDFEYKYINNRLRRRFKSEYSNSTGSWRYYFRSPDREEWDED